MNSVELLDLVERSGNTVQEEIIDRLGEGEWVRLVSGAGRMILGSVGSEDFAVGIATIFTAGYVFGMTTKVDDETLT